MDFDPCTKKTTVSCKIHSIAGLVMFISLLAASTFAVFATVYGIGFRVISVVTTLLTLYFTFRLSKELSNNGNVGLYQRLSYGCQLIWLSFLSVLLFVAN